MLGPRSNSFPSLHITMERVLPHRLVWNETSPATRTFRPSGRSTLRPPALVVRVVSSTQRVWEGGDVSQQPAVAHGATSGVPTCTQLVPTGRRKYGGWEVSSPWL